MKRKLLLSSGLLPMLLASGAMGQVVNFMEVNNGSPITPAANFNIGDYYNELYAGQGAYSDPGNNIWNGFANANFTYGSTYVYSGAQGSGGPIPVPNGNPGNPYAAYNSSANGWVSSDGPSLFDFSGPYNACGNATSDGQWNQIVLKVVGYGEDTAIVPNLLQNGAPNFLFSSAAQSQASNAVFVLENVPTNNTYGLFLYGAAPLDNRGAIFSLNSGTAHNGIAATLNGGSGSPAQTFVEGQNLVIFENVTADVNSNITITASPNPAEGLGTNADDAVVNGFQLIYNPQPAAIAYTVAQNVYAGGAASFYFTPVFAPSPTFHWQFVIGGVTNNLSDGGNISGATTTNLVVSSVSGTSVGLYQCVISTGTTSNTTPAMPLTILTSTAVSPLQAGDLPGIQGLILQPGDQISDFNNYFDGVNERYESPPPQFNMVVADVEDDSLSQYVNLGADGTTNPFVGPVGFVVTPKAGITVVDGLRIFTASRYPQDDPADYLLEGSSNGGTTYTAISGGSLALPTARNAAAGPINITNEALQEINFVNTNTYGTYRFTFTNTVDPAASNGVQVAEIQLLGSLAPEAPGILVEPSPSNSFFVGETALADVTPTGPGPLSFQWYYNGTTPLPTGTSALLTLANFQSSNVGSYTCTITSPYGTTNSTVAVLTLMTNPPAVITFNGDGAGWATNQPIAWPGAANDPNITNNVLTILDSANGENDSVFYTIPQYASGFIASFTFQFVSGTTPPADGVTFCIQNDTATNSNSPGTGFNAIGGGGGGIGYSGLNNSFALEFNVYSGDHGGEGFLIGTNGNVPDNDSQMGNFLSTSPVQFTNSDPVFVQLYYQEGQYSLVMVDTTTNSIFTTNFAGPNITAGYDSRNSIIAGRSGFVGFTGGSGALNSTITISNFVFSTTTPPNLSISPGASPGTANVTWPISVAALFKLQTAPTVKGPWTTVTAPVTINAQTRNQVSLTPGAGPAFYRLSLQ
jgi:hypothetical protein